MNDKTKTVMLRNVPASTADLARQRVVKANLSDVDRMEPYVMAIWESAELQPFKIAMDDGSVVEGSPRADDQEIARLCRDAARAANDPVVSAWDLDHCRRAVGAVFRRFATSRIQVAAKRQA